MKYLSRTLIIVLVISTLILMIVIPLILKLDSKTRSDLFLSEIISICVEGILFVGIIESIENAQEIKRVEKLKLTLINELAFLKTVLTHILLSSELGDIISLDRSHNFTQKIQQIRYEFPENESFENPEYISLAENVSKAIKSKATLHLERLRFLSPVAAEIGDKFLNDWLYITDKLNDLSQKENFDSYASNFQGCQWTYTFNRIPDLFIKLDEISSDSYNCT